MFVDSVCVPGRVGVRRAGLVLSIATIPRPGDTSVPDWLKFSVAAVTWKKITVTVLKLNVSSVMQHPKKKKLKKSSQTAICWCSYLKIIENILHFNVYRIVLWIYRGQCNAYNNCKLTFYQ